MLEWLKLGEGAVGVLIISASNVLVDSPMHFTLHLSHVFLYITILFCVWCWCPWESPGGSWWYYLLWSVPVFLACWNAHEAFVESFIVRCSHLNVFFLIVTWFFIVVVAVLSADFDFQSVKSPGGIIAPLKGPIHITLLFVRVLD